MTTDLWALAGMGLLQWVLLLAAAIPRMFKRGIPWSLSNRDDEGAAMPAWAGRLQRASDNLAENLLIFAIFVLVVQVAGEADGTSAAGSLVFAGARIAHAIVYGLGVTVLRTVLWFVGVVGMFMVASVLL